MDEKEILIGLLEKRNGDSLIAISLPRNIPHIVDKIRVMDGRKWNPESLRWELPIAHLPRLKQLFPEANYTQGITDFENKDKLKQEYLSEEFKKLTAGLDLSKPLPNGMTPFEHQRKGILGLLKYRRVILADDMGLGKTLEASTAAMILSQQNGWQIITIVPISLSENWERSFLSLKISKLMFSIHSWAKIPDPPLKDFILIADECFPTGTIIQTNIGEIPVEEIGHYLIRNYKIMALSFDYNSGKYQYKPIERFIAKPRRKNLIKIVHEYGEFICTEEHKIWTKRKRIC